MSGPSAGFEAMVNAQFVAFTEVVQSLQGIVNVVIGMFEANPVAFCKFLSATQIEAMKNKPGLLVPYFGYAVHQAVYREVALHLELNLLLGRPERERFKGEHRTFVPDFSFGDTGMVIDITTNRGAKARVDKYEEVGFLCECVTYDRPSNVWDVFK